MMKVILAIVTSVDGKSTRWGSSPKLWASKEDQMNFYSLVSQNNLIAMGKNTFIASRDDIKLSKHKLRIVMASNIDRLNKFRVAGQLEFTNEKPKELIKRLTRLGYKQLLLVGGPKLNTAFFKDKLVNELLLTIEPKIFGAGLGLVAEEKVNIKLKLLLVKKLNPQGTLLLKYKVI